MKKRNFIFIVAGRLGKNLIVSKVLPFSELGYFERILIFSEGPGYKIKGAEYISLPGFIVNCRFQLLKRLLRIIYEPLQLIFYALKYKPAYINGIYTNPKGINSWFASFFSGSRCIISVIGGKPEIETSFFNRRISLLINLFLLKRCYVVFTKGEKDNKYLISKGIDEKKLIVYNGAIDLNRFCYNKENKDIDLIYVGYFDNNKGPGRFINVCKKILSGGLNINAVMLGTGPLFPVIKEHLKELGLTEEIKLLGKVEDVEKYLKRSKILLLPSRSEGLSSAMLEAMACGCVPVVSDVGNNSEAARNAINSFLVKDYEDINEYFFYVSQLLKDTNLWKELSVNAIKTIFEEYSPKAQSRLLPVFSNSYDE